MISSSTPDKLAEIIRDTWPQMSWRPSDPVLNGIKCPDCGEELFDTNPEQILLSMPPQYNIHYKYCKYTGTRY